jgi:hypothetical protein
LDDCRERSILSQAQAEEATDLAVMRLDRDRLAAIAAVD